MQEEAAHLIVAYSGEKARDIQTSELEVVNAWRNLQFRVGVRKSQLNDSNDIFRFLGMVRDLVKWMNDMTRQMTTQEKPRFFVSQIFLKRIHVVLHTFTFSLNISGIVLVQCSCYYYYCCSYYYCGNTLVNLFILGLKSKSCCC